MDDECAIELEVVIVETKSLSINANRAQLSDSIICLLLPASLVDFEDAYVFVCTFKMPTIR